MAEPSEPDEPARGESWLGLRLGQLHSSVTNSLDADVNPDQPSPLQDTSPSRILTAGLRRFYYVRGSR
jgi:hypothetical protein